MRNNKKDRNFVISTRKREKKLHKSHNQDHKKKDNKLIKLIVLICLISVVYLFLYTPELRTFAGSVLNSFEAFLSDYEILFSIYSHFKTNIGSTSYLGVGYVMALLSLFFLPAPIEIIFVGYLMLGFNPWVLVLISASANTVGHIIDFLLGVLFGRHFLKNSHKLVGLLEWFKKRGGLLLFVINFFPFPAQIASVGYGFVRYNLGKFVWITFISRAIKFIVIVLLFRFARPLLSTVLGI
ncbi:MAG: YqaA family protein [Nanoarchaeota archaeon]